MKRTPHMQKLEETLRASKIVAGGFLGTDERPLEEIIEADGAEVTGLDRSIPEIATRMWEITDLAKRGLETSVEIDEGLEARVIEARGPIPCPWPHPGRFSKTVVMATRTGTGKSVRWTELNIHMIEAHGFFEGRGSGFRIEPADLIEVLFGPADGTGT
jgi:hypothetical protein